MFVFHQTRLFNPRDDATLQRVDRARRSKRQASMVARQALTRVPDKVGGDSGLSTSGRASMSFKAIDLRRL